MQPALHAPERRYNFAAHDTPVEHQDRGFAATCTPASDPLNFTPRFDGILVTGVAIW